jgi:peptidoglycan-associated lipoprotein
MINKTKDAGSKKIAFLATLSLLLLSACGGAATTATSEETLQELAKVDRVYFDTGRANLDTKSVKVLAKQAALLQSDPTLKVEIGGYTDERGSNELNLALGERRANAVKNYLVKVGKVEEERVSSISYGKEKPVEVGNTPEILAKNRVVITIAK